MASFTYSTGIIPGNTEVYTSEAAPVWPVTVSGTVPTTSFTIDSAYLRVCVRRAYGNPYYSFFVRKNGVNGAEIGLLTPDAAETSGDGVWNQLFFSAEEIARTENFIGIEQLCLRGNLHTAMQISGTTEITLTVNWNGNATPCGGVTKVDVPLYTNNDTVPVSWSGATGGVNNSITGYGIWYADFDHYVEYNEYSQASYTYLTTVAAASTSASASFPMVTTPGWWRVFRFQTQGTAGPQYYAEYFGHSTPIRRLAIATAPQSIVPSTVAPAMDTTFALNWTMAAPGENDTIAGYVIYRSENVDGPYAQIGTVETTETYGSFDTISPDVFGGQYFYKIVTLSATNALYNSPLSTVYAEVTSGYGLVTSPTEISVSPSQTYPGGVVRLTWSGAEDGYLNPVAGYQIGRSTTENGVYYNVGSTTNPEAWVAAPTAANTKYYYKIMSVGTVNGYNSDYSAATGVVTAVTPPTVAGTVGRTNALV